MSSHITYSCPVCGTPVGRTDGDDEGFFLYQSEITCQKCGHKFIVGCYYEWENLTPELKKAAMIEGPQKRLYTSNQMKQTIIRFLILSVVLFPLLIVFIPSAFYWAYKKSQLENAHFTQEQVMARPDILASIERTKDNEYRKMLTISGRKWYGIDIS